MDIKLINLGLFILVPALSIMFICLLFVIPQLYNDDWYFDDDEDQPLTQKEKLLNIAFKSSLSTCCFSAFIFAFAMYMKGFYLLSIFLIVAPIWILWGFFKDV